MFERCDRVDVHMTRAAVCLGLAVFACVSSTPVGAGFLSDQVPEMRGAGACWERRYSDAHLSKHPGQKVTELRLFLSYDGVSQNYVFDLDIATRERSGAVYGACRDRQGGAAECMISCANDAFQLRVAKRAGSIMVDISAVGRLAINARCPDQDEGAPPFVIDALPDDELFLLFPASVKTCSVQPFRPYLKQE